MLQPGLSDWRVWSPHDEAYVTSAGGVWFRHSLHVPNHFEWVLARWTSYSQPDGLTSESFAWARADFISGGVPVGSFAFAASIVGDGIGSRPGQQDRIGREIDVVRPVAGVEDQAPLVGRARRGDAGDFQTPQLDEGPPLGPQGSDVVRRPAGRLRDFAVGERLPR
jgi:hypothetical protein